MEDLAYHRPASLEAAGEAVRSAGYGKFVAGGQSLIPLMKLRMAEPDALVALAGLPELAGIERDGDVLVVGANSTHAEVAASDVVGGAIPALADLAGGIGDPQVRNRGTLGGSVAHADPAADYPAALLALDASVVTDRRTIAAQDFLLGMFRTPLEEDEIITSVRFRIPDAASYAKFADPASKYAIVGVMVARFSEEARVAVTGASASAFRASEFEAALGGDFSPDALEGLSVSADGLTSSVEASAEYRAHLVGVMARRAVRACA